MTDGTNGSSQAEIGLTQKDLGIKTPSPSEKFARPIDAIKLVEATKLALPPAENPTLASWILPDGSYLAGKHTGHTFDALEILGSIDPTLNILNVDFPIQYLIDNGSITHITGNGESHMGVDLSYKIPEAGVNAILDLQLYNPMTQISYTISAPDGSLREGIGLKNLPRDLAIIRAEERISRTGT